MECHVYKSGVREACQRLSILEPILGVMFAPRLQAQTFPLYPRGSHGSRVPTLSLPPAAGEFAGAGGEMNERLCGFLLRAADSARARG